MVTLRLTSFAPWPAINECQGRQGGSTLKIYGESFDVAQDSLEGIPSEVEGQAPPKARRVEPLVYDDNRSAQRDKSIQFLDFTI